MSNPWIVFLKQHRNKTGLSGPALFQSASIHYRKQRGGSGGLDMRAPAAAAVGGNDVVFVILQNDIKHLVTRSTMPEAMPHGFSAVKATLDQRYAAAPAAHPDDDEVGVASGTDLYVVIQTVRQGQRKKVIYVSMDQHAATHVANTTPVDAQWTAPHVISVKVGQNWIIDLTEL